MSYPSDHELIRDILTNLEERYPNYFVMKPKMSGEDLLVNFPDCCSIKSAPYVVRLLTDTRVEYWSDFRYSKLAPGLPNATLMGEATACGTLGLSQRMLECLDGHVEGSANICSLRKKK